MPEPTYRLAELTRDEAGQQIPQSTVILPTAAIEQHGPHLPILTDSCIVETIVDRVAKHLAVPVLVAPVVCYGSSHHHFPFPGVMSVSSHTFAGVLRDLIDSLARSGARRVYLLNGHGGNDELVRLIAREEAPNQSLAIGAASYWSLAWEGMLEADAHHEVGPLPGHAGDFETSLMLALRPELVTHERLPEAASPPPTVWPHGSRGTVVIPFQREPRTGTSDSGRRASAEWGNRLLDIIVRDVSREIEAFHRMAERNHSSVREGNS